MRDSRRSMKEEMKKRMETEQTHYQRRGSLFRSDIQAKFFKCKEGPNLIDILAYLSGKFDPIAAESMAYVLRIFLHKGAAQDGGDIICIEQTFKDVKRREEIFGKGCYCPVCKEYRAKVAKGATKEETDNLRYANWPRTIYNVFDRRDPGAGCQVWETSSYLLQQFLDVISKKSTLPGEMSSLENYIAYMDIEDGKSISFERQGTDEKTKFIGVKFEDRRSPITNEVADAAQPLDELIAWPTMPSLYESFWGVPMNGAAVQQAASAPPSEKRSPKYEKKEDIPASLGKAKTEEPPAATTAPPAAEPEDEEAILQRRLAEIKSKKNKDNQEKAKTPLATDTPPPPPPPPASTGNECPSGHEFGKDIDEKPECEKCNAWKECAKESDRLERAAR